MKQTLLALFLFLLFFNPIDAQRVNIAADVFAGAITAVAFTSDEYGRVIDYKLFEGSDMPEESFISLSTGTIEAPYHLSVVLRNKVSRPYSLVDPITCVTIWQNEQDTVRNIDKPLQPEARSKWSQPGSFHFVISHNPNSKEETLRDFRLLNFKGNKYDFEISPCRTTSLRKIGNLVNSGSTDFRFVDRNEHPHIFHLQSDQDDRYREVLLPAYKSGKNKFTLDYDSLPESGTPVDIELGNHAMRTISVLATTLGGETLILGENAVKCPANFLTVRPVVGESVLNYRGRLEYYDIIDDKYVRTITRNKQADFIDDLSFDEIPFYSFNFNLAAPDAVLNLEDDFKTWRVDFKLEERDESASGTGGSNNAFRYYQYYGERYRAYGNWSVVGNTTYPTGLLEIPAFPEGIAHKFFTNRFDSRPEAYAVSVTTESDGERITYTLRKKDEFARPLLERELTQRY